MSNLTFTNWCGRCGEKAELSIISACSIPFNCPVDIVQADATVEQKLRQMMDNTQFISIYAKCPRCENTCIHEYQSDIERVKQIHIKLRDQMAGHVTASMLGDHLRMFPSLENGNVDPDWPPEIGELVLDIDKLFRANVSPSLILTALGTTLEVAAETLEAEGKNLFEKIDNLAKQGLITEPLKEWSHEVRKNRNKAVHEANGTIEDAEELYGFLKSLLEITFTLPAKMQRRMAATGKEQ